MVLAFNHDRRAFNGPGRIPLEKAINYAIDRPELARAFGCLAGKRTDQLLPPDLARPTSIYPLKGADPATARKWLARARPRPDTLVLYATTNASSVRQAQVLALNLKQIGIDLDVKYFDAPALARAGDPRRARSTSSPGGWVADYADGAPFLGTLLNGRISADGQPGRQLLRRSRDQRADRGREPADRRGSRRKAWADLDVDLMRDDPPWAPFFYSKTARFVSKSLGCFLYQPVYGVDFAAVCKTR